MWEEPAHLLFHLFDSEILTGIPVYLVGKLSAVIYHLLHCHVLRELSGFVAVNTVILVLCDVGIRAEYIICERHSAALTEFHIHVVSNFLSVHHYLFKILASPVEQSLDMRQKGSAELRHSVFRPWGTSGKSSRRIMPSVVS